MGRNGLTEMEIVIDNNIPPPQISVLMGVYYRHSDIAALRRSVQSIQHQTVEDLELLICDDGSSREAAAYLEQSARKDPRIRLVRGRSLISLACKLNACFRQARGVWIARMDDDDVSHLDRLEKQMEYLIQHTEIDFLGCSVNHMIDGKIVGTRCLPERPAVKDFLFTMPFVHPALMFRRDALERVGGYREDRTCVLCEDYDLLLRLYESGCHGGNLQEILLDYSIEGIQRGRRRYCYRINEAVTRFQRFKAAGLLPAAFPYVLKPLAVGMVPTQIRNRCRDWREKHIV